MLDSCSGLCGEESELSLVKGESRHGGQVECPELLEHMKSSARMTSPISDQYAYSEYLFILTEGCRTYDANTGNYTKRINVETQQTLRFVICLNSEDVGTVRHPRKQKEFLNVPSLAPDRSVTSSSWEKHQTYVPHIGLYSCFKAWHVCSYTSEVPEL